MFFAPSDKEFELSLGDLVKSWEPIPYTEYTRNVPGTGMLFSGLTFAFFFLSVASSLYVAIQVIGRQGNLLKDPVWWILLVVFIALTHGSLLLVNNARHSKTRLGVHKRGLRFGKQSVRFDQLERIATGEFQFFREKYFPWAERYGEMKQPEIIQVKDLARKLSFTLKTTDGKQIDLFGVLGMFGNDDMKEFLKLLSEHAPDAMGFKLNFDKTELPDLP